MQLMRRLLSVLVTLVLALGAAPAVTGGGTALAQAGPQPWTVQPGLLQTVTGPADAEIPVTLDYDLYLPDNATALTPQPAMVLAHGFGNAKDAAELRTLAAFFASHGYVTLASTHMGFGGSTGCIALDLADYDGRNVVSLIDVLAARPEVLKTDGDPVVGMLGGSYGGGHQGGVAAQDDRLDAIAPHRTWNSLQYSLVPNNRVTTGMWNLDDYTQGVFKQGWTSLFYALGSTQPLMGNGGCDPITQQLLYPGQVPCLGFDPRVCGIFTSLTATGDVSEAQRELIGGGAIANQVDDIDVPVLLMQGQSDTLFTLTEAIATYEALDARGVDVDMVFNWGGHGYQPRPGEGDPYSGAFDESDAQQAVFGATYMADRMLRFFDEHLRGVPDTNPRVAWFADWIDYDVERTGGTAAPAYRTAADYPVGGVTAFHLDLGAQALVPAADGAPEPSSASIVNPPGGTPAAHSETPNFTGEGQPGAAVPPQEVQGQHVALDSPPLTRPLEVVGTGSVLLALANANSQDAVVFVKVYDVAPDGSATLVRRLVTASRVPAEEMPGRSLIRLPGLVHRFDVDHRVRLVLATTDDSYRNATVADQVTFVSGGDSASIVSLPTVEGPLVDRIAGPDRVQTAVQLSRTAFEQADAAVLAAAGDFPDALAAGGLAATVGGPLLLTDRLGVRADVVQELRRLGVQRVYVAGGVASLSSAIEADLAGFDVQRLAGADRFATAAAVAAEIVRLRGPREAVALARGDDFIDALAAGSLAAQGVPVLLTSPGSMPRSTRDAIAAMDPQRVLVVGGPVAISEGVVTQLDRPSARLAGATRYETARAVLAEAERLRGRPADTILIASGATFADALAAAPAAQALDGVLMLTDPRGLEASPPTGQVLQEGWRRAYLVGGYAALSPVLDGQIAVLLDAVG